MVVTAAAADVVAAVSPSSATPTSPGRCEGRPSCDGEEEESLELLRVHLQMIF